MTNLLLSILPPLVALPGSLPPPGEDWLYHGDEVRLVSFEVATDSPGRKDLFIPGQRSGFMILGRDNFSISAATPFEATYVEFAGGVLKRTVKGFMNAKPTEKETSATYQDALIDSLSVSIDYELGRVAKQVLSKGKSDPAPPPFIESGWGGSIVRTAFGKSWKALKRITIDDFGPKGTSHRSRTDCVFKVILP